MAGQRKRDSQKTKVLTALGQVHPGETFQFLNDAQIFANKITLSVWGRDHGLRDTRLLPDPKQLSVSSRLMALKAHDHDIIYLPKWASNKLGVLRGLTFLATPAPAPLHGTEYCTNLLFLVGRYMGKAHVNELRQAFHDNKVRTYTWSDDAKERARLRYAEKDLKALLKELS